MDNLRLSPLRPLLFIRVNDGERFKTLFHKCGEDGSKNVFLPLTADQSGHQKTEIRLAKVVRGVKTVVRLITKQ